MAEAALAVVLPAYNGCEALQRCLAALERHTPPEVCVRLVDDASTDPRVLPLLQAFARRRPGTTLRENAINGGFVASVNGELASTAGDVVLLNSDTEVTAGWIEGLLRCRDSSPAIGIVCPLSNNATLLSLQGLEVLFGGPGTDAIADCVRAAGPPSYPRIPTAVGFCMLVTRALLERAGPLDPAFGHGYGEENDLSMRATDLGFEIACCDDVYVRHAGAASFGTGRAQEALRERNRALLDRRWPRYEPQVSAWMRANPLRPIAERINAACERSRMPGRPRVLHVMHGFDTVGGVEQHTRGIIEALREDVAFNVVVQNGAPGAWCDFVEERRHPHLRVAALNQGLRALGVQVLEFPANVRDESVERAFEAFLAGGYDVVHFHSPVGWNTMRLPGLARRSGARVVVGVHDMGWMCADYNMVIGVQERPCGRVAARGADEGCVQCIRGKSLVVGAAAEDDVPDFIDERLAAAARAMADADVVVCPSRFAAGRVEAAFGAGHAREIRVIGHGVQELPRIYRAADRPVLTVAVLGRFSPRKGAPELLEAAGRLQGERIVFESWGPIDGRVREQAIRLGVRLNGPYGIADLARHLRGVDLVMVPTRLEETFCLTLAEAQALGIPVAAARIGAIPERIRDGENGFLFEPGDVDAMVALLVRLRDDRSLLAGVAARLAAERPKTIEENAAEYLALYRELAARHGEPAPVARRAPPDIRIHASSPRRRTPLGSEDYDRWLDAQSPMRAPRAGSVTLKVIELPEGEDAEGARALNRAIAQCEAEWVVLAEAGDRIAEGALEEVSAAIAGEPRAAFVFGDHDAMSSRGERYDPVFKPRFDAELLRHAPYVAGLCALRRERCLAMGGLEVGGWLGVVEFALRLASLEDPALLASVRGIVVHRLDSNLAKLERPEFKRRMGEIVDKARGPAGARAVRLAATPGTPAMWSYGQAETAGVSVFLHDARSKRDAELCLDALLRAGSRIAELFVDLPEEAAAQLRGQLGAATPLIVAPLDAALQAATSEWIAVVDARCRAFTPGWVERLLQGIPGDFVAGIAPQLATASGSRISGAMVMGGGPWSVVGPMPVAAGRGSLDALYSNPREVACLSPHLSLWRGRAVRSRGAPSGLARAGRFGVAHLSLAMRERGLSLLERPFAAARLDEPVAPPRKSAAEKEVPADVAWMRERLGARLEDDPCFHPALARTSASLALLPRFAPPRAGVLRVCAFPYDHWGSGAMRVRQPCAAMERAGIAEVAMMQTQDSGRVPNGLEWRRIGADTLLAHNFFHDFQLVALDEYARSSSALRVLGMDDLLTDLPAGNPYAKTIYPDIAERIARAVARCDRLVVSTQELADAYGRGTDVRVIPNAIDAEAWGALRNDLRDGPRPRVGWAGGRQHHDDLLLLEQVVAATAGEVDWVFLGMCPPSLRRHAAEYHTIVSVADYPAKLASLGLDIAVAPLQDNAFNRAKSDLKILEYGALGIPVIASPVGPYHGTPVLLAADRDGWIDALRALVRDPDARGARGRQLQEWVLTNRSLAAILPQWQRALSRDG